MPQRHRGRRAWKGTERPHPAPKGSSRQLPVDRSLAFLDLVRIGHAGLRLGHSCRSLAPGQLLQQGNDLLPPQHSQPVVETGRRVIVRNRYARHTQHVAGIQARIHLHEGDARLRIPGLDGTVNGRRAAPARQQAGMDVEAAQPRQVEHPLRQDEPIGRHHHHIGLNRLQRIPRRSRFVGPAAIEAQAAGLEDFNAMGQRGALDGRGLQLHATAGRSIGLGQHQRHGVPGLQNGIERHLGKFRRAGKHHLHLGIPCRVDAPLSGPRWPHAPVRGPARAGP